MKEPLFSVTSAVKVPKTDSNVRKNVRPKCSHINEYTKTLLFSIRYGAKNPYIIVHTLVKSLIYKEMKALSEN